MRQARLNHSQKRTATGPQASVRKRRRAAAPVPCRGRVLVMDDEEFVGELIDTLLFENGYQASVARSGDEAIESFRKARELHQPYDVVILDLNIPVGMQGAEALAKLRDIDAGIKAVVLTGDIVHPVVTGYESLGFKSFLLKPFTRSELMQAIERALA